MTLVVRLLQLLIIAVPILLFGWLWRAWSVPSGVFSVERIVGEASPFIDGLAPSSRVGEVTRTPAGDPTQPIIGDPAFFFLHPHRDDFSRVNLEVWFQNGTLPIVELGALASAKPEVYRLVPFHNRLIDESTWDRIDEDGMVLLQRERVYDSLAEFLATPPSRDRVATYRASFDVPYRIAGYQPLATPQTIDVTLRGHHEFKTYIKDETLAFTFTYMDMNRDEGADVVRATVFNEVGLPVAEARAQDDDHIAGDSIASGLRTLTLTAPGLSEGVYKVVFDASRDIFMRSISTPQQKMVFLGAVFIGDDVGFRDAPRGATLFAQGGRMKFQTRHSEGVQTVTAGSTQLTIDEPYEWYTLSLPDDSVQRVDVPAGDVEVIIDDPVAFSRDQYFNPDPVTLRSDRSLADLDVDYVLSTYTSPRQVGDWLVADVAFDVAGLHEDEESWKFSFSTPEIEALAAQLNIHKIVATFYREISKGL